MYGVAINDTRNKNNNTTNTRESRRKKDEVIQRQHRAQSFLMFNWKDWRKERTYYLRKVTI